MYEYRYKFIGSSGTNQYVDVGWFYPSGTPYIEDVYGFPPATIRNEMIISYLCNRCGSKLLVNKEKLPAVMSLNCPSCGSPDLKEI